MNVTPDMIREMMAHLPYKLKTPPERWEWMAAYLNESIREPGKICPCCNVTRGGELMDHLPLPNTEP